MNGNKIFQEDDEPNQGEFRNNNANNRPGETNNHDNENFPNNRPNNEPSPGGNRFNNNSNGNNDCNFGNNGPNGGPNRFDNSRAFDGPNRGWQNDGPNGFQGGPDDGMRRFNDGPPNRFNDGPSRFNDGPNRFNDGPNGRWNDGPSFGPNNFNDGPNDRFDRPPNGPPGNFNDGPPRNFNDGPGPNFGPNNFHDGPPPGRFSDGPGNFNDGPPPPNGPPGRFNDAPPGPGNFNEGPPRNFNDGPGPNNLHDGPPRDRFNDGPPGNFYDRPPPPNGPPGRFNDGPPGRFNNGPPGNFNDGPPRNFNGPPGSFNDGPPGRFNDGPGNFQDRYNGGPPGRFNDGPGRFDWRPANFNDGPPGRFSDGPGPGNFNDGPPRNFNGPPGNFNDGPPGRFFDGPGPGNFNDGPPGCFNDGPGRFDGPPGNFNDYPPGNFNDGPGPGRFNDGPGPGGFDGPPGNNFNNGPSGRFFDGPGPGNFNDGPPRNFNDGPPGNFNDGPGRFDGPPGNFNDYPPGNFNDGPGPGRFNDGPGGFDGPPGNFNDGPGNFNDSNNNNNDNDNNSANVPRSNYDMDSLNAELSTLGAPEKFAVKKLNHPCRPESTERSDEEVQKYCNEKGIRMLASEIPKPIFDFNEAILPEEIHQTFEKKGWRIPTPIQSVALPIILMGRDMVGVAETGSGKTAAYVIPALIHSATQQEAGIKPPYALILCPTRELALQVGEVVREFSNYRSFNVATLFGGSGNRRGQIAECQKNPEIVIATPGRLLDLTRSKLVNLSNITYLVIDEADRMLEQGFEANLRTVVGLIQEDRHTLMFSATWPKEVRELAKDFLNDFVYVVIGASELTIKANIRQLFEKVDDPYYESAGLLTKIVKRFFDENPEHIKILVFVSKKRDVNDICNNLRNKHGIESEALHGDMEQDRRNFVFDKFKKSKKMVLVATDLASRGLDIVDIDYVINYNLPNRIEDYIHRIGRTARNDNGGTSISFFSPNDKKLSRKLVKILKKVEQPVPDWLEDIANNTSTDAYRDSKQRNSRYRH